jgi:hypothetical protein
VIEEPQREGLGLLGLSSHEKKIALVNEHLNKKKKTSRTKVLVAEQEVQIISII